MEQFFLWYLANSEPDILCSPHLLIIYTLSSDSDTMSPSSQAVNLWTSTCSGVQLNIANCIITAEPLTSC